MCLLYLDRIIIMMKWIELEVKDLRDDENTDLLRM